MQFRTWSLTLLPFLTISLTLALGQDVVVTPNEPDLSARHYRYPQFQEGLILRKDKDTSKAALNYNLLTKEIIVDLGSAKAPYPASGVKRILIDSLTYVAVKDTYYELLYQGSVSLLVIRGAQMKRLDQDTGLGRTTNQNAYEMPPLIKEKSDHYKLKFEGSYGLVFDNHYFLFSAGKMQPIRRMKDIINYFPDHDKDLQKFTRSNKLKMSREGDLIRMIDFCVESE